MQTILSRRTIAAEAGHDWRSHAGQYFCSGRCYQVSCATVALLKAAGAPSLRLSTQASRVLGSSSALVLPYGLAVAFNLLPCTTAGKPHLKHPLPINSTFL